MSKKKSNYIIYTDGGCAINPGGPGGCAAVIINTETGEYKTLSEGYVSTTNNRMEMQAIILALNAVDVKNLTVYSDSTYVIKTMNGQFSKKKNKDLWAKISAATKGKHITWEWIRGHNGDQYNEMCDALCTEAMNGSNLKIDKGYAGQPVAKKTEETNPRGAMGVLIEIPSDFIDQKLSITSVSQYAEDYQVNPDCAKAILTFAKSPRITFKTYAAIKTGGIDYWSRKTRKAMSEYLSNADQLWEILSSYFPEEKEALTAMRWYMRGLPVKDCIRKVLVDQEISYNCIRK